MRPRSREVPRRLRRRPRLSAVPPLTAVVVQRKGDAGLGGLAPATSVGGGGVYGRALPPLEFRQPLPILSRCGRLAPPRRRHFALSAPSDRDRVLPLNRGMIQRSKLPRRLAVAGGIRDVITEFARAAAGHCGGVTPCRGPHQLTPPSTTPRSRRSGRLGAGVASGARVGAGRRGICASRCRPNTRCGPAPPPAFGRAQARRLFALSAPPIVIEFSPSTAG